VTDLDGDGATNSVDLGLLLGAWRPDQGLGDVNKDGSVDALDLGLLMAGWGALLTRNLSTPSNTQHLQSGTTLDWRPFPSPPEWTPITRKDRRLVAMTP